MGGYYARRRRRRRLHENNEPPKYVRGVRRDDPTQRFRGCTCYFDKFPVSPGDPVGSDSDEEPPRIAFKEEPRTDLEKYCFDAAARPDAAQRLAKLREWRPLVVTFSVVEAWPSKRNNLAAEDDVPWFHVKCDANASFLELDALLRRETGRDETATLSIFDLRTGRAYVDKFREEDGIKINATANDDFALFEEPATSRLKVHDVIKREGRRLEWQFDRMKVCWLLLTVVEIREEAFQDVECAVCAEPLKVCSSLRPAEKCRHFFHVNDCLERWDPHCPLCDGSTPLHTVWRSDDRPPCGVAALPEVTFDSCFPNLRQATLEHGCFGLGPGHHWFSYVWGEMGQAEVLDPRIDLDDVFRSLDDQSKITLQHKLQPSTRKLNFDITFPRLSAFARTRMCIVEVRYHPLGLLIVLKKRYDDDNDPYDREWNVNKAHVLWRATPQRDDPRGDHLRSFHFWFLLAERFLEDRALQNLYEFDVGDTPRRDDNDKEDSDDDIPGGPRFVGLNSGRF